jgi:hypothetical protein
MEKARKGIRPFPSLRDDIGRSFPFSPEHQVALPERPVAVHVAPKALKELPTMVPCVPRLALRHTRVMLAPRMRELDDKL